MNDKLAQFVADHEKSLQEDLDRIALKYNTQIESYEKKGLNALTKKLIEKAKTELVKAQDKKREE